MGCAGYVAAIFGRHFISVEFFACLRDFSTYRHLPRYDVALLLLTHAIIGMQAFQAILGYFSFHHSCTLHTLPLQILPQKAFLKTFFKRSNLKIRIFKNTYLKSSFKNPS